MKKIRMLVLLVMAFSVSGLAQSGTEERHNTLSAEEKAAGWELLFDGHTSAGWRSIGTDHFPEKGWELIEGELCAHGPGESEAGGGGDIITLGQYGQFELVWEWKMLTEGGNSGVKYFVKESLSGEGRGGLGLEYQILDDEKHPWMLEGRMSPNDFHTLGALYEFFPPRGDQKVVHPIGEWNQSRIVSRGKQVEHWLNGKMLLAYERGGKAYMKMLKKSKFSKIKGFGLEDQGHILLQDHGSQMRFRNIKIRTYEN